MDGTLVFVLFIAALVMLALGVLAQELVRQRWFSDTGLVEWTAHARTLPWRDRWALYRANQRGRAAPPRLAALAVQRGEAGLRTAERLAALPWVSSRLGWALIGVYLLNALLALVAVVQEPRGWQWVRLVMWLVLAALYPAQPVLLRRAARNIARSVEPNRPLAAQGPG